MTKRIIFLLPVIGMLIFTACNSNRKTETAATKTETVTPAILETEETKDTENAEKAAVPSNYTNASITFDYPAEWSVAENQGEDGSYISFLDSAVSTEPVFWFEQGEEWRVNLEATEADYQNSFMEMYQEIDHMELADVSIGGYDSKRVSFTHVRNGETYKMIKYVTVVKYVSFAFTVSYPSALEKDYEEVMEAIFSSIKFLI